LREFKQETARSATFGFIASLKAPQRLFGSGPHPVSSAEYMGGGHVPGVPSRSSQTGGGGMAAAVMAGTEGNAMLTMGGASGAG
jgi:hypothetical protein